MWKKIVYYALMIIFGIMFMLMVLVSTVTDAETKFIKKSINSGDYTNALKIYTSYANKNALFDGVADTDEDCEVRVFEFSYINVASATNDDENYMDIEYGIALEKSSLKRSNPSSSSTDGTIINQCGYIITNSVGETFHVYDNGYVDGNATLKNKAYLVEDSNGSTVDSDGKEYGVIDINNNYYEDIYMFYIPRTLLTMYSGFSTIDIKSVAVVDNSGNTYTTISFDTALTYEDTYLNKLYEMVVEYNKGVDEDDFKEYKAMYDEWEAEYLEIEGAIKYLRSKDFINGWVYFRIIISFVLYVLFVLILGDILVGKRRIIALFNRIGHRDNNGGGSFQNPQGGKIKASDAPDLMDNKVIDADVLEKGDRK